MADQPPTDALTIPRGRHAPPLEVRLTVQRRRLFQAAAAVFARVGYADASAEAISREAGMSKATFYEHFANKEECLLILWDEAAVEIGRAMSDANRDPTAVDSYEAWVSQGLHAFLDVCQTYPNSANTLLVQILGAGPKAAQRRDAIVDSFAQAIYRDNRRMAPRFGFKTFATPDDAYAVIGAFVELISRWVRTGHPANLLDTQPVMERIFLGALDRA